MKLTKLIIAVLALSGCTKKSPEELLIGEWWITSWKNKSDVRNNDIEEEMLDTFKTVIFEKDSLHITWDNEKETYRYYLIEKKIIVPENILGPTYQIKLLDEKELHLLNESAITFKGYGEPDKELHSTSKITLRKK